MTTQEVITINGWLLKKVEDDSYSLVTKHSNKVLDVLGNSQENAANIVQYEPTETESQKWLFLAAEDAYFYIVAKHSGKVLDVKGGSKENLADVIQYDLVGSDN